LVVLIVFDNKKVFLGIVWKQAIEVNSSPLMGEVRWG